jgi:hypothetical protein
MDISVMNVLTGQRGYTDMYEETCGSCGKRMKRTDIRKMPNTDVWVGYDCQHCGAQAVAFYHKGDWGHDYYGKRIKTVKKPKSIGKYGGGGKYYNCMHHRGSGMCTHPLRSEQGRGGSRTQGSICRYTSETEHKCPYYFGSNPYYKHDKGGKK